MIPELPTKGLRVSHVQLTGLLPSAVLAALGISENVNWVGSLNNVMLIEVATSDDLDKVSPKAASHTYCHFTQRCLPIPTTFALLKG